MVSREEQLSKLHSYIKGIDNEVTMMLQSLQWDRKRLLEGSILVSCVYEPSHKVPPEKKEVHEAACLLRREGYSKDDKLLPQVFDPNASTVVKLSKEDIKEIISNAAQADPSFQRGAGAGSAESAPLPTPLTAERLQVTFSADERRAIHDAVAMAAPDFEHVDDLDLTTSTAVKAEQRRKSRLEVLAELRDMRRRRARYRGPRAHHGSAPAAGARYSLVLRHLIQTQMDMYTGVPTESTTSLARTSRNDDSNAHHTVNVKQEPLSDEDGGHSSDRPIRNINTKTTEPRHGRDRRERDRWRNESYERNRLTRNEIDIKQEPTNYDESRTGTGYDRGRYADKHSARDYTTHRRNHSYRSVSHSTDHREKHRDSSAHAMCSEDIVKRERCSDDNERNENQPRKKRHKEKELSRDEKEHRNNEGHRDRSGYSKTQERFYDDDCSYQNKRYGRDPEASPSTSKDKRHGSNSDRHSFNKHGYRYK